jgi:hypothetical protein
MIKPSFKTIEGLRVKLLEQKFHEIFKKLIISLVYRKKIK